MAVDTVTVTVAFPVVPGDEADFEAWSQLRVAEAAQQPGYIRGQVLAPEQPGPDWLIVHQFTDARAARTWQSWFVESPSGQHAVEISWDAPGGSDEPPAPRAAQRDEFPRPPRRTSAPHQTSRPAESRDRRPGPPAPRDRWPDPPPARDGRPDPVPDPRPDPPRREPVRASGAPLRQIVVVTVVGSLAGVAVFDVAVSSNLSDLPTAADNVVLAGVVSGVIVALHLVVASARRLVRGSRSGGSGMPPERSRDALNGARRPDDHASNGRRADGARPGGGRRGGGRSRDSGPVSVSELAARMPLQRSADYRSPGRPYPDRDDRRDEWDDRGRGEQFGRDRPY